MNAGTLKGGHSFLLTDFKSEFDENFLNSKWSKIMLNKSREK